MKIKWLLVVTGLVISDMLISSSALGQSTSEPPAEVRKLASVTPPRLIKKVDPDYPPDLLRKRIAGAVFVDLTVDEKGIPRDVRVTRPANRQLAAKAIAAVTEWRFQPATLKGKPVSVPIQVSVDFRPY